MCDRRFALVDSVYEEISVSDCAEIEKWDYLLERVS